MRNIDKILGETTEYDKKAAVEHRKVKSWLKSVSAFANGVGGCLIFGICDDNSTAGLDDVAAEAEFISQKVKERLDPVPQIVLKIEQIDGKNILILHVAAGEDTPYYYIGDGVLETFVRIGNETVVADATEHKRLVLRGRNSSFDARPSDEALEDFSFTKLRGRYYAWNGVSLDPKLYRSFGMVDKQGLLTQAGLLMADECPLRQSRVFCTRWNGTTKSGGTLDALDSQEINGSLVKLLEETMNFVRRNTQTMWYKEPSERVEVSSYVERGVTEAVVNALAHRDYLITGSEVHLDIYDDRLVVYSPGAMPEGRFIQNLKPEEIPSVRRNPVIADIFSQIGVMERKGSGMGKIVEAYTILPYFQEEMRPMFFSDRAQFTVTFPNILYILEARSPHLLQTKNGQKAELENAQETTQKTTQKKNENQRKIILYLRKKPFAARKEIAQAVGLTEDGIKYNLRVLQLREIIRRVGSDNGGYWEVLEEKN